MFPLIWQMRWICFEAEKGEWLQKLRVLLSLGNYLLKQTWGDCRSSMMTGSNLPAGMQKAITELDLGFLTSSPLPWENMNKSLSFPMAVRLAHQLDDSSDKIFRHLFRQITTSPSKTSPRQRPHHCHDEWFLCAWGLWQPWTLHDGCAGIHPAHTTGDE